MDWPIMYLLSTSQLAHPMFFIQPIDTSRRFCDNCGPSDGRTGGPTVGYGQPSYRDEVASKRKRYLFFFIVVVVVFLVAFAPLFSIWYRRHFVIDISFRCRFGRDGTNVRYGDGVALRRRPHFFVFLVKQQRVYEITGNYDDQDRKKFTLIKATGGCPPKTVIFGAPKKWRNQRTDRGTDGHTLFVAS